MLPLVNKSCAALAFPARFELAKKWFESVPRNTVIVIEGMDGVGKSTVAQLVVDCLGSQARNFYSLPEDMRQCRQLFDAMAETEKRQFYLIGNLVAMAEANANYCVFDRSFASTVAYQRGTMASDLGRPLDRSSNMVWPKSLRPTHYFYLTCDETVRNSRLCSRSSFTEEEKRLAKSSIMRDEIDWTYRHFEGAVIINTSSLTPEDVAAQIVKKINE